MRWPVHARRAVLRRLMLTPRPSRAAVSRGVIGWAAVAIAKHRRHKGYRMGGSTGS